MIVRSLSSGVAALLVATLRVAAPAVAQPVVPDGTPPDRVGRVAAVTGSVSFHLAGATEWQVASRNLPVTTGTGFWVPPLGEASIDASDGESGARIVLGPSTALDVDRLDALGLAGTQPQGESYWRLQHLGAGNAYVLHTPRGTVTMATIGRYEVVSGDTEHPTVVTVVEGEATLTDLAPTSAIDLAPNPATAERVGPGQTLTITGDGGATPFAAAVGLTVQDAFLRHVLAEEAPSRPPTQARVQAGLPSGVPSGVQAVRPAPAIIAEMAGSEPLYDVGQWSENAEYGPVWYPPAVDYVPYRQGRWAYVAPWGWTWVDDAPWGFAPSHYGRWAQFEGRWGWVPGRDWAPGRPPVYAPALVGFIGSAALGAGLGAGFGAGHGPLVGWLPLGPREAYRPAYRADERTLQTLNQPTGASIQINNQPATINRSAVTIVPAQVLTTSAPVMGAFRPGSAASIGALPVLQDRPQAMPTRATIGATRAVLQQINPAGLTAPTSHGGSGPSLSGLALEGARPSVTVPGSQVGAGSVLGGINPGGTNPGGSILGGAAVGAMAGGLLRGPARANVLPSLRQRGDVPAGLLAAPTPGAIARPRQPTSPSLLDPSAPFGRRGGDGTFGRGGDGSFGRGGDGSFGRGGDGSFGRGPVVGQPVVPRPAPVAAPVRPELPRVIEGGAAGRERPSGVPAPPVALRPEIARPATPRVEMPRQEAPRPVQRPEIQRPEMPRPEVPRPEVQRPEVQRQEMPRQERVMPAPREFQRPPAPVQREAPPAARPAPPTRPEPSAPPRRQEERPGQRPER